MNVPVYGTCGGNLCVAMQWESPTQERDSVRVGALMSNTDGFIQSIGRRIHITNHESEGLTSRESCHVNFEEPLSMLDLLTGSQRVINISEGVD